VTIDDVPLPLDPSLVTWLVYKPTGVVTTMDDPQDRPTIRSLVPSEPVTKPVGRLDLDSEGLLLMTNDGDLANVVTHPRFGVPKTYQVLVPAHISEAVTSQLVEGVDLDDGLAAARSARILDRTKDRTIIELVLTEGRNREIRRMFDALELPIDRLVRSAIGSITDRRLAPGGYRELTLTEIRSLYTLAEQGTDDA
jgi:23S rRNA pseudouridine2605 synthase